MCFHPVNEPSVKWRSSSVLDASAESPGHNGNCGGWWFAEPRPSRLRWQLCILLWPTPSNHPMDGRITGTARLVCFGAGLPSCKVFYLFSIPLCHPSVHPSRQLPHYNHIILSGIQSAAWEKILVASGACWCVFWAADGSCSVGRLDEMVIGRESLGLLTGQENWCGFYFLA